MDSFNQDVLVLELITLGGQVKFMVNFSVDLLGFTISFEESTEDTAPSHPDDLRWHTGVFATLSATSTTVTS